MINRLRILSKCFTIVVILLLVGRVLPSLAGELKPFTTDGCSEFPDGTLEQKNLWRACCVAHDGRYWLGGSYAQRQQADVDLQACVEQVGELEIGLLMLAGVRVGGSPFWNTEFRWGYGWPYWDGWRPRGYKEMTGEEAAQAIKLLPAEELRDPNDVGSGG